MNSVTPATWDVLSEPFLCFGPLVTTRDILHDDPVAGMGHYDARVKAGLAAMAQYAGEFLTSGHPELGRPGPVCPFTAGAIQRDLLRLTASTLDTLDEDALVSAMDYFRGAFRETSASKATDPNEIYRSIMVVFPNLPEDTGPALIERVQKALKPAYVEEGLMIGEFYPGCAAAGLHNPEFRPLHSPVISIAIRHITVFDAPFMLDDERYIQGFYRHFGDEGERRIQSLLKRAARGSEDRAEVNA